MLQKSRTAIATAIDGKIGVGHIQNKVMALTAPRPSTSVRSAMFLGTYPSRSEIRYETANPQLNAAVSMMCQFNVICRTLYCAIHRVERDSRPGKQAEELAHSALG